MKKGVKSTGGWCSNELLGESALESFLATTSRDSLFVFTDETMSFYSNILAIFLTLQGKTK